jgi:vitamin B12 transporter
MNKTTIASLIGLLLSSPLYAQTITTQTEDVVVTASRIEQPREKVIADVSIITRNEIERAGQSTFLELLQTQPGVEITSNGGTGKTSGIFLRGTNSSHVLILLDGLRIDSATAGTTTLENLPLAQIEKIEILRGPASTLYGQDAIGGVIQIFSKRGNHAPKLSAGIGYGTYDTKTADASFSGSVKDTSFATSASSYATRGFSAYKTKDPNLDDRDGYRNLAFSGSLSHKISEDHDIGFQFLSSEGSTRFDNRFNVFSSDPGFSDNANLSQLSYALTSKHQVTSGWLSKLKLGEGVDEVVNYSVTGRDVFRTKQKQFTWQNDLTLPLGTLTLLYERLEQRVKSTTDYDEDRRNNDGYVASYLLNHGPHSFQASYRSDHNTQFGNNDTGGLGYGYSFTSNWRATASYGTAFKAPTFNDLYFPGFSNPNLKPEKSRNFETSLRYEDIDTSASLTLYENKIRDLIALDFVTPPFVFNVNEARIQGMTVAGTQLYGAWQLKASIDIQSPRDKESDNLLVRRANRHASASINRTFGDWRFGAESIASSKRYNDAANTVTIDGYAILNLTADYSLSPDWKLQARANNVLDKDYGYAFEGPFIYNTPGSNLFVSIRYQPAH